VEAKAMDKFMTIAEIESRYQNEWILLENPETNEALEVLSGRVLFHSADREEFDRKMVALKPKKFAILYPEVNGDATFVL
jgi:hypothetical protein